MIEIMSTKSGLSTRKQEIAAPGCGTCEQVHGGSVTLGNGIQITCLLFLFLSFISS